MLYTPPFNPKKIIIIGAIAIVLAVSALVAIPLFFKDKTLQAPVTSLSPREKIKQQKIQRELKKLEAMRKSTDAKQPTSEEIQKEFAELEKQRAQSNAIPPTPEQIQAELKNSSK